MIRREDIYHRERQISLMDREVARLEHLKAKVPVGRHRTQLQNAIHHLRTHRRVLQILTTKKQG